MDDTKNESEHLLNISPDCQFEKDNSNNLNCKQVGTCEIEEGKAFCKSAEKCTENECDKNVSSILLPSTVTHQEEIHFPHNITKDDPSIYGKWLIFINDNLTLQDHLWIQLQSLLKNSDLILLESSTAKKCDKYDPLQGVIKCYTCKDINAIKRAGLAIQKILTDEDDLYYKTNEASQNNLYTANRNKCISKFMLRSNGKLYKRYKQCRWIKITSAEYQNFPFEENYSESEESDESDKLDGNIDERCQFEYERTTICKCVEEFTKECEKNADTILLPSTVTHQEEIYFPQNITKDDPSIYGKWLIFINDNLTLQDHLWIQLQSLLRNNDLILLESSTAKKCNKYDPLQGVIKCYTCKDINVIKRAGLAIQKILKDDTNLNYKTNEASQNNLYTVNKNRCISKFMLGSNRKLYKRDKLSRWIQISSAEYQNFTFEENYSDYDSEDDESGDEYYSPFVKGRQFVSACVNFSMPSVKGIKKSDKHLRKKRRRRLQLQRGQQHRRRLSTY